jgi:hypothetical protein
MVQSTQQETSTCFRGASTYTEASWQPTMARDDPDTSLSPRNTVVLHAPMMSSESQDRPTPVPPNGGLGDSQSKDVSETAMSSSRELPSSAEVEKEA